MDAAIGLHALSLGKPGRAQLDHLKAVDVFAAVLHTSKAKLQDVNLDGLAQVEESASNNVNEQIAALCVSAATQLILDADTRLPVRSKVIT